MKVYRDWISVKDRLPKHDHRVLVYTSDDTILIDRYYPEQRRWSDAELWGYRNTHWMPMPDSPGATKCVRQNGCFDPVCRICGDALTTDELICDDCRRDHENRI